MTATHDVDMAALIDLIDPLYWEHFCWTEEREAIASFLAAAGRDHPESLRQLDQVRSANPA